MKKIKLSGKLAFNKETVSKLNQTEMNEIKGGLTFSLSGGARCQWSEYQSMHSAECKVEWRHSETVSCTA